MALGLMARRGVFHVAVTADVAVPSHWTNRIARAWSNKGHPEDLDGAAIVRRVSYAQGRRLETATGFYDPMIAFFRRDKKESFQPVRFNEFRELWRDSAALFQVSEQHQEYDRAPTCLHSLAASELKEILPRSSLFRMSVFG